MPLGTRAPHSSLPQILRCPLQCCISTAWPIMGHRYNQSSIYYHMQESGPLRPSQVLDGMMLGTMRKYIQDIDALMQEYRKRSEGFRSLSQGFWGSMRDARLDPYVDHKLRLNWAYFPKRVDLECWPYNELGKIRKQITELVNKFQGISAELTLPHVRSSKELIFRTIEYLFGDAKNNEVAKHRAYLEQYDQEIKKLTDKKAVEELDRNLRELRDQEKECLSSIIRDLESKFKEIERHGIDVVCKPPPPPPEPATEPQKQQ